MTRLPFGPLEEALGPHHDPATIAATLRVNVRQVHRWRHYGLTDVQADRLAVTAGLHPAEVWPTTHRWAICAGPGCRATIAQPRAGRPRLVCSRRCANRRWYAANREAQQAAARARWAQLTPSQRARRRTAMAAAYRARHRPADSLTSLADIG